MKLNELEIISQSQKIYDGFNNFMLSSDIKVFGKMLARTLLFEKVLDLIYKFGSGNYPPSPMNWPKELLLCATLDVAVTVSNTNCVFVVFAKMTADS